MLVVVMVVNVGGGGVVVDWFVILTYCMIPCCTVFGRGAGTILARDPHGY